MVQCLGMGKVYIEVYSVEQVSAEIQIFTKTFRVPATNLYVSKCNYNTVLQSSGQDKSPFPVLSQSKEAYA